MVGSGSIGTMFTILILGMVLICDRLTGLTGVLDNQTIGKTMKDVLYLCMDTTPHTLQVVGKTQFVKIINSKPYVLFMRKGYWYSYDILLMCFQNSTILNPFYSPQFMHFFI